MTARYAGKYRRNPYPLATRIKNKRLTSSALITEGGRFGPPPPPPQDKFSFFAEGNNYFYIFTRGYMSSLFPQGLGIDTRKSKEIIDIW